MTGFNDRRTTSKFSIQAPNRPYPNARRVGVKPSSGIASRTTAQSWTPSDTSVIYCFLTEPQTALTPQQFEEIAAGGALRQVLVRALRQLAARPFRPIASAACDAPVLVRDFKGGTIRLEPSSVSGQFYIKVQTTHKNIVVAALILETPSGEVFKIPLPKANGQGESIVLLDSRDPDARRRIDLIADPTCEGYIIDARH